MMHQEFLSLAQVGAESEFQRVLRRPKKPRRRLQNSSVTCQNDNVRFQSIITSTTLGIFMSVVALSGCGSSDENATEFSSTSLATTTIAATTSTSTTTTTVYTGPPTLAPNESLPVPEAIPPEDVVEPEILIGELVIPALLLTQPIFKGVTLPTLDKGVGYWPGTAMPGRVGNVVLGGHRTSKQKPFRNIDLLVPGDEVYVTTADGTFVYAVTGTQIIEPTDVWIIDQTESATLTLFACHPPHSVKQRIAVFAEYLREESV
jgi:sortase A